MSMKCRQAKGALVVLLVLCLLAVGVLASAQSITHESHHAHHQKATHGTVLCSWMCAAGQMLHGILAPVLIEQSPVRLGEYTTYLSISQVAPESTTSRG